MEWREREGVRWLEARLPGARAAFTTRLGGVSEGAFRSLNVGLFTDDEPDAVRENRTRLTRAVGRDPGGVLFGFQVHGDELVRAEQPRVPNRWLDQGPPPPEADAQATGSPRLTPLVQVADCLPVALCGPRGVAMLHCGWRGLAAGLIARGVEEVEARAAAIGPGIGPCCYEVGDEVLEPFVELGPGIASGRMLDLTEVATRLLGRSAVDEVELSGLCTCCEADLFFSHRRARGKTGRQAGLAWLEAGVEHRG